MRKAVGFSLVEMLVSLGIIAVLVAILIPVIGAVQRKGAEAQCIGNLQQISHALGEYRTEKGVYPPPDRLMAELGFTKPLTCPADPKGDGHDSYTELYNYYGYESETTPTPIRGATLAETLARIDALYSPLNNTTNKYWDTADPTDPDDASGPETNFPGLLNQAAPPNTVVIACPNHGMSIPVLRLDGTAVIVRKPGDGEYWQLSQK